MGGCEVCTLSYAMHIEGESPGIIPSTTKTELRYKIKSEEGFH